MRYIKNMATTKINIRNVGGDQRYVGTNEGGDHLVIDASEDLSLGMRPMEALLVSLGACSALDVAQILEKRRTPVEEYRIEIEGERAEEHPRRYTKIKVRHIVRGEGIDEKQLERAVSLSHEKYCSVHATLNADIEYEALLAGARRE